MKIAIAWKWWSGKSTISTLLAYHLSKKQHIYTIDADYNVDFSYNLWINYTQQTPTFHRNHKAFRKYVWLQEDKKRQRILSYHNKPIFNLWKITDQFTEKVTIKVEKDIDLMISWLWDESLFQTDRCWHWHIAPLKYYLSLLDTKWEYVLADTSAWTDMFNCWFFNVFDIVYIVFENSPNSIRVAKQISNLCKRLKIKYGFIINKLESKPTTQDEEMKNLIIAQILKEEQLDFKNPWNENILQLNKIENHISAQKEINTIENLKHFYNLKNVL